MQLSTLLLYALTPKSKIEDNKLGIKIDRTHFNSEEETILFFEADKCRRFHNTCLRETLEIEETPKCCDGIIFYHKKTNEEENPKIVLCFVELKGSDLEKAVEQISKTYEGIITNGLRKMSWFHMGDICTKALILTNRSIPSKTRDQTRKIYNEFSGNIKIEHIKKEKNEPCAYFDIEKFLKEEPLTSH